MAEDNSRRYPPNLRGLLNFCTEYTQTEDAPSASGVSAMPEETRQWLSEAIDSLQGSDPVKLMLQDIQVILSTDDDADAIEKKEEALENLQLHTEDVDLANDFHRIGGFHILPLLLSSRHAELRWRAAELIATLTQNNRYCQNAVLEVKLLPPLMKLLDNASEDEQVRVKALYAVSCVTRESSEAQSEFVRHDGFSVLLRAMQSDVEKLQMKSAFLMSALCQQQPLFTNTLCDMGAVEQLVGLLSMEHRPFHEQLIVALYHLIAENEQARADCHRPEFALKSLLLDRKHSLEGKEEFQEELEYVGRVYNLCFADVNDFSAER